MAVANGFGKVVTSGSVFMYDTGDTVNSYIGEPTTNYIWHQNPRIDSSYESYMPGSGEGQIATLHPGAIRVYNTDGTDISDYRNTGINVSNSGVEWYNTRHAYWILDPVLNRPVVRMFNQTGVWQAKHFNPAIGSLSNIGVTAGTKYVLSWLQYVDNLDRSAYVGLYSYSNTNGYNNFWDGLQAAYNTKTNTWQRVYAIFTATNNGQLGNYHNGYMYGQAVGSGDLRIADVQLEVKTHATPYSNSLTRSATQGLLPIVGNSTIDLSNVSFDSNAQMTFDGTNDYIQTNLTGTYSQITYEFVGFFDDNTLNTKSRNESAFGDWNANRIHFGTRWSVGMHWNVNGSWNEIPTTNLKYGWNHYVLVWDHVNNKKLVYLNGILSDSRTTNGNITMGDFKIGVATNLNAYYRGNINIFKTYNRSLSAAEVKQNYNKYKTRFNLS